MAEFGQVVRVHYLCTLDDGSVLEDTYKTHAPLLHKLGSGKMIAGFDVALGTMEVGEKRNVHIPAALAYGVYDDTLIEEVSADEFPNSDKLPVGQYIELSLPSGTMRVKVLKIENGTIYFDLNHELAGNNINFEIELLESVEEFKSNIEKEIHRKGCACGCDALKEALGEGL